MAVYVRSVSSVFSFRLGDKSMKALFDFFLREHLVDLGESPHVSKGSRILKCVGGLVRLNWKRVDCFIAGISLAAGWREATNPLMRPVLVKWLPSCETSSVFRQTRRTCMKGAKGRVVWRSRIVPLCMYTRVP